jgi:hypothetical protein
VDAGPDKSVSTPIFTTSSDTCADAPVVSGAIKQPPSNDNWIALGRVVLGKIALGRNSFGMRSLPNVFSRPQTADASV